ncbi:hypothetical protein EBQ90_11160 [bacterium]|nr:hypothetical protein [bacterium]
MTTHAHSETFLRSWLVKQGLSAELRIQLLLGDGSTRCFYRVTDSTASWILISDPEWKQSQDYSPHQKALAAAQLPVPQFRHVDPATGLLLMEDLGDELLQLRIQKRPLEGPEWLTKAAELLAHLHGKLYPVPKTLPIAARRFDAEKYFQELCFTLEHLRGGFLGLSPLPQKTLQVIRAWCEELERLRPEVFCHRDYHCRNIIVHQERLSLIDFQDARLGPPAYDLASLVFDAYTPMTPDLRTRLINTYRNTLEAYPISQHVSWEQFQPDLMRVAYQRTLKAAGSFASFWTRNKKKTHLQYIEPALRLAQLSEAAGVIPSAVAAAFEIDTMLKTLHEK